MGATVAVQDAKSRRAVILCALGLEYEALRQHITSVRSIVHPAGTHFETGLLAQDPSWQIVLGEAGEGNLGAAILTERAIAAFEPDIVLFVGVAGALKDELRLGDVVVATDVYFYHSGKADDAYLARPRTWRAAHVLEQRARRLQHTGEWLANLPGQAESARPGVHLKPIAAGDVVLTSRSSDEYLRLRMHYNDAVAVEMEGAGLAHAAHLNRNTPALIIRGVSDHASQSKRDNDAAGWQSKAASHAAAFAASVLSGFQPDPVSDTATAPRRAVKRPRVIGEPVSASVSIFHDRAALRQKLAEAVLRRDHRIISVVGRRGIGKSGLVAKVLADMESNEGSERLDGLVYLSTRTGGGQLDATRIFHSLMRLLDRPERDKYEELWAGLGVDAMPDLLRAVGPLRAVVVLDNLDDLQDSETGELVDEGLVKFLGACCSTALAPTVVTTSQWPIALPAELLGHRTTIEVLDGLDTEDAIALLRRLDSANLAGLRDRPATELLTPVKRVYAWPRGLELLVTILSRKPTLTVEDLFRGPSGPETLLATLVSQGYRGLDAVGVDVVRVLSLADTPLPLTGFGALLASKHARAAVAASLERLITSRLVSFDKANASVRLHPIDADYVRATLVETHPEIQRDLDESLAYWWHAQAESALGWRTGEDVQPLKTALQHWIRASNTEAAAAVLFSISEFLCAHGESAFIEQALGALATHVHTAEVRPKYEFARGCVAFYARSPKEAVDAFTAAHAAAVGHLDAAITAKLARWRGTALRYAGDARGAVEALQDAIVDVDGDMSSRHNRVDAFFELGLSYGYLGDAYAAHQAATMLESILKPSDPALFWARLADVRALAQLVEGAYADVIPTVQAGIEYYLDSPRQAARGYLWNVRGLAQLHLALAEEAIESFGMGLQAATEVRILRLEGFCLLNLSWAHLRMGSLEKAWLAAQGARSSLRDGGVRESEAAEVMAEACRMAMKASGSAVIGPVDSLTPQLLHDRLEATLADVVRLSSGTPDLFRPAGEALEAAIAAAVRGETS